MERLAILFIAATCGFSETKTVCKQGCAYSDLQLALDNALPGDTIQLQPGLPYIGTFRIVGRPGGAPITLTCNTSILPWGIRITENSTNVCEIYPTSQHGLVIQSYHFVVTDSIVATNIDDDSIAVGYNYSLPPESGVYLTCFAHKGATLPAPLQVGQSYFVTRNYLKATFRHAPQLEPIDLTTSGNGRIACSQTDRVQNWTIEHIKFKQTNLMPDNPYDGAVFVGYDGEGPNSMPRNIRLRHVIATGDRNRLSQLRHVVWVAAENVLIEDSWLGVAGEPGYESHVVTLRACAGSCRFVNNSMVNGTIGFLTGGGPFGETVQEISGVELNKNYIYKETDYLWLSGSGAPNRTGQEGAMYYRTDISGTTCSIYGKCYHFVDGSWRITTTALYRLQSRQEKSAVELKGCKGCRIEGNIIRNVFAGSDSGNSYCILLVKSAQNGRTDRLENVTVRNNKCIDTYSGVAVFADDASMFDTPGPTNIVFQNNAFLGIGNLALSNGSECTAHHARMIYVQAGLLTGSVSNNTFRPSKNGCAFYPFLFQQANGYAPSRAVIENNIAAVHTSGYGTFFADGVNCETLRRLYIDPSGINANGVFGVAGAHGDPYANGCLDRSWVQDEAAVKFASTTNVKLLPSSPFSAENPKAMKIGTNGGSLGANSDELELAVGGVLEGFVSQTGLGSAKGRR